MSKKSTARTGSEGDADSTTSTGVFTNICSGSSSCKSKRDFDSGPFGDVQQNQERFRDFLVLMFPENENRSETSHSTDEDQVLYNLKNDYLEKLNIVRKRLNLVELPNDTENTISALSLSKCKITEITDRSTSTMRSNEDRESQTHDKHDVEEKETCSIKSNSAGNVTDAYELSTIFSPSPSYINSADSISASNIYDLDYNPPKKKFCHRLRTPKFSTVSESNIPYYTKVSLRDDLFKNEIEVQNVTVKRSSMIKRSIKKKFTKNKGIQCSEAAKTVALAENQLSKSKDINLFPKVIIEVKEEKPREEKTLSPRFSKQCPGRDKTTENSIPLMNFVRDSSEDESYLTVTTNTTIIDTPKKKKVKKKRFTFRNKNKEKLTMWEEVRKLHSTAVIKGKGKTGRESEFLKEINEKTGEHTKYKNELSNVAISEAISKHSQDTKVNISQYIRQYITYKATLENAKNGIAFGASVVTNNNKFQASQDNIYYSGTSFISDEDKCSKDLSSTDASSQTKTSFKALWRRICPCLVPKASD